MGGIAGLSPAANRDLEPAELERLVDRLTGQPHLWRHLVQHSKDQRFYIQLHRDPHLDIWLICWDQHQETGLHDHDRSAGAVQVIEGTLLEDYFAARHNTITLDTISRPAGSRFSFNASYIHDVRHDGGPPATSIHAYSPALWRMGHYTIGPHGLGRTSITYIDEIAA
jgi:hypothetical protein